MWFISWFQIRHILEVRLAAAEELRKAAEQLKLEKEESARKALVEQERLVEKVVHESQRLQQEAEENSKVTSVSLVSKPFHVIFWTKLL